MGAIGPASEIRIVQPHYRVHWIVPALVAIVRIFLALAVIVLVNPIVPVEER